MADIRAKSVVFRDIGSEGPGYSDMKRPNSEERIGQMRVMDCKGYGGVKSVGMRVVERIVKRGWVDKLPVYSKSRLQRRGESQPTDVRRPGGAALKTPNRSSRKCTGEFRSAPPGGEACFERVPSVALRSTLG
jgi:hypothetical protein